MTQDRWADLPLRMASAVALLLIFSASLYFGRIGVLVLGVVAVVAMQWELARMFGLNRWRLLAVAACGRPRMVAYGRAANSFDPEFDPSSRSGLSSNHAGRGVYLS